MAGEPGGGRDHVLLGDPALDEPVGVRELERADAAVGREVGVEDDEILALGGELEQGIPVRLDDVLARSPICARVPRLPLSPGSALERRGGQRVYRGARTGSDSTAPILASSSSRARRKLSSSGAPACHLYVPPPSRSARGRSMNETPRPLIVRAINDAAARRCSSLTPECVTQCRRSRARRTNATSQPNARNFASRLPSARISSVGLSDWRAFRSTTTVRRPSPSCAAACSPS